VTRWDDLTDGGPDPDDARWLVSAAGRRVLEAVSSALAEGDDLLPVATALRRDGIPVKRAALVTDVATTQRRWGHDHPPGTILTRAAAEQASHPVVAAWRARRFAGVRTVVDLCCGVGVDAMAIARHADAVVGVEVDETRGVLAAHNLATSGADGGVVVGDASRPPVKLDGPVHADPSRRRGRRRARRLDDYDPPVSVLMGVLGEATSWGIVLSPAVNLADPALPGDVEIEFIQVGSALVEAVSWGGGLRDEGAVATATLLPEGITATRTSTVDRLPVAPPGEWLLEVVPAAVRARLHDVFAEAAGGRRLARGRALFTTTVEPEPSPWYDAHRIEAVLSARPRPIRAWLEDHPDAPVEVLSRGVDIDVDHLWRAIGAPPRGPQGRRIHLIRLDEGAVAIITRAPDVRGSDMRPPSPGDGTKDRARKG
jgi:hypothetical protein